MLEYALALCFLVTVVGAQSPVCEYDGQIFRNADCKVWYMCARGHLLEMPACPDGTVYSITHYTCVPEGSELDDCPVVSTADIDASSICDYDGEVFPNADCKGWYLCADERVFEIPCLDGTVFSISANICVYEGSELDDCHVVTTPKPLSIEEQCALHSGTIPHPTQCQLYYNCSYIYDNIPRCFEQHMLECPYPNLFDVVTLQCLDFEQVSCGNRVELKDECEYLVKRCGSDNYEQCSAQIGSCRGLWDGYQAHKGKLWSPDYIICFKQRTVDEGHCGTDADGRQMLFHPDLEMCVSLDRIPQEHGGTMMECEDKTDGDYPDEFGRCDRYHVCTGGHYVDTVICQGEDVYDSVTDKCQPADQTCPPCGSRTNCM